MTPVLFLICGVGFVLLYYSAEWLVRGSAGLARTLGVSPIVIGLTVVAFGTSTPELVVSVISSIKDMSMIAVGNVVGSNICNMGLILGTAAVLRPLTCHSSVVQRDIPIMLGISLLLLALSLDSRLSRAEGAILFLGIVAYTYFNYRVAMKAPRFIVRDRMSDGESGLDEMGLIPSRSRQIALIAIGIAGVIAGAEIVVESAVKIMRTLGVEEKFIGLTVVAFGTSLPELATSVVAALRKEMDISVGNLVGSNVFNLLSVLGASALVRPIPIPGGFVESGLVVDYGVMLLVSFLPWVMMGKSGTMSRTDGFILLCCYGGYLTYLVGKTMW